jgi:hypothetical protein
MAAPSGRKKLSRSALEALKRVRFGAARATLSFGAGPLGLQIIHVPGRGVLVWHLEGQAKAHEVLSVGAQVVAVGGTACEETDMQGVFDLVSAHPRPVDITFRIPEPEPEDVQVPGSSGSSPAASPVVGWASSSGATAASAAAAAAMSGNVVSPQSLVVGSPTSGTSGSGAASPSAPSTAPAGASPRSPGSPAPAKLSPVEPSLSSRLRKLAPMLPGGAAPRDASPRSPGSAFPASPGTPGKVNTVSVVFQEGPLGLQISDVGKRVLVTSFDNGPDGGPGQAEASGIVHFGYQVIRVGKMDVEGLNMQEIGKLVAKQRRPVVIEFRKLFERERAGPARARTKASPAKADVDNNGHAEAISPLALPELALTAAAADQDAGASAGTGTDAGPDADAGAEPRGETRREARSAGSDVGGAGAGASFSAGAGYCNCQPWRLRQEDPLFFHFQMLCKASQIKILLDYEASSAIADESGAQHPAFELSTLALPQMYALIVSQRVPFHEWPGWIREKYIEAYIEEQRLDNGLSREQRDRRALAAGLPPSPRSPPLPNLSGVAIGSARSGQHVGERRAGQSQQQEQQEQEQQRQEHEDEDEQQREAESEQVDEDGTPRLCAFCSAVQTALPAGGDPMFVHFGLLFQSVRFQALSRRPDQTAYVEYLDVVDVDKLYSSSVEDCVPMHTWGDWIAKQVIWGYEEELYKVSLSGDCNIDLRELIKENKNI